MALMIPKKTRWQHDVDKALDVRMRTEEELEKKIRQLEANFSKLVHEVNMSLQKYKRPAIPPCDDEPPF